MYKCICKKKNKEKRKEQEKKKKKEEVALDILKGLLPPEETVATRTYIKQCNKLFTIFNNKLEVDPKC